MQRAIITAPVARNLVTDFPSCNVYPLPGATNGTLQAWSTPDGDDARLAADAQLTIYTTFAAMPAALKKYLVLVRRSDDPAAWVNDRYVRIADLGATDYVRFWSTLTGTLAAPGPLTAKLLSAKLASDRFYRPDCQFTQSWCGVDDASLGDTN